LGSSAMKMLGRAVFTKALPKIYSGDHLIGAYLAISADSLLS